MTTSNCCFWYREIITGKYQQLLHIENAIPHPFSFVWYSKLLFKISFQDVFITPRHGMVTFPEPEKHRKQILLNCSA